MSSSPKHYLYSHLTIPANLFADDAEESEKALGRWLPSIHFEPYRRFPVDRVNGLLRAEYKTAANLPDAAQQSHLFRLCRVWLRPGFTGMLVRCMLRGGGICCFCAAAQEEALAHTAS